MKDKTGILNKKLNKILLKKALGFYYVEECMEYAVTKESNTPRVIQESLFEGGENSLNFNKEKVQNYSGNVENNAEILKKGCKNAEIQNAKLNLKIKENSCLVGDNNNILLNRNDFNVENLSTKIITKKLKNSATKNGNGKLGDVYCGQAEDVGCCYGKRKSNINESAEKLTLVKKKVTTHYIPPDLLATKMLLENNSQVESSLKDLTDKELIELAKSIIEKYNTTKID